jgi:hypothetical protein
MDGWRGLAVGMVSGASGAFFWPVKVAATGSKIASVLASVAAGLFIPLYNGLSDNWGIKKTDNPKKVAFVYGDLGYWMNLSLFFSNVSASGFIKNASDAGHQVSIWAKPNEYQFINICKENELVIVLAHGRGIYLTASPQLYDTQGQTFTGFDLGGTDLNPYDSALNMGDPNSGAILTPPKTLVTANEIQGKIDNSNLVVAAATCRIGMTDRMAKALGSVHFVGANMDINAASAEKIMYYAAEYLNSNHDTVVQKVQGLKYVSVYSK